jgi:2-C-methyl-D-erythritol 4-phosphate cytidylyltransferase
MIAALIPAAGKGERLGKGSKAFLPLDEYSILHHTLQALEGHVDEMLVAVSEEMLSEVSKHILPGTRVILGGATRQETVYLMLKQTQSDSVLIHDAARPFLSFEVIVNSIQALQHSGAATVVRTVADTLIHHQTLEVTDRSLLRAVQTPQSFKRDLILQAHEYAREKNIVATDDVALLRLLGHDVTLVEGSSWLDKITTAEDYERARKLVHLWTKGGRIKGKG